ncbi:MAG: T9SS C-terminal target domain-containing protein [Bacteroidetes bacterium]|nr:MAG: T9SS C-terminal target domain-containing protein [Bacteroidota bacterium]
MYVFCNCFPPMNRITTRLACLFLGLLALPLTHLSAQCVPDPSQLSSPGIYPASLPLATGCQPYEQDISFLFPQDTTVNFAGTTLNVPFLYFTIDNVVGVPVGMDWVCNLSPDCKYVVSADSAQRDTAGCIRFFGTPAIPADYTVTVELTAYALVFGSVTAVPFTYAVPFTVSPCSFTGSCYTLALNSNCEPAILQITNNIPDNGNPGYSYQWSVVGDNGFSYATTDENPSAQVLADAGTYIVNYELTIDTLGYFLNGAVINTVNCSDIGSAGDLYWILKNPAGVELVNTTATPVNNGGNSLPLSTGIANIALQNGSYEFQVWDEDAVFNDQGCATNTMGSGASVFFTVPPASTGPLSVTVGGLSVTFTIDKPVQVISCADTLTINPVPNAPLVFVLGDTLPADTAFRCDQDTLFLHATGADSVQWYRNGQPIGGATDTLLAVLSSGNYSAESIDPQSFCRNASAAVTVETLLVLPPSIAFNGNQTMLVAAPNPAYRYDWYKAGSGLAGSGAVYQIPNSGSYFCVAVDTASGCQSQPSATIAAIRSSIEPPEGLVGEFRVYPNPAAGVFFVELSFSRPQTVTLSLSDLMGRAVSSQSSEAGTDLRLSIGNESLAPGLYLLEVRLNEGVLQQKVVIY